MRFSDEQPLNLGPRLFCCSQKTLGDPDEPDTGWLPLALLSAVFAAPTTIFAKVGLKGVDSDLATLIRTFVIVGVLGAFVALTGKWSNPFALSGHTWLFLVLSALATGASWVAYFRGCNKGRWRLWRSACWCSQPEVTARA